MCVSMLSRTLSDNLESMKHSHSSLSRENMIINESHKQKKHQEHNFKVWLLSWSDTHTISKLGNFEIRPF